MGISIVIMSYTNVFSLSTANAQDGARVDVVMNGFWGEVRGYIKFC